MCQTAALFLKIALLGVLLFNMSVLWMGAKLVESQAV